MRTFWNWLAGLRLTLWLLVLLSLNLFIGSFHAKFLPVYDLLNRNLLLPWFMQHSGWHAWWLLSLLALLTLLGINTFACTLNRVLFLWQRRGQHQPYLFCLLLAPSVMHGCFLLLLMGHALTDFTGVKTGLPARAGASLELAGRHIAVLDYQCRFTGAPLPPGSLEQCRADLELTANGRSEWRSVEILEPVYWQGLSLHLGMVGKPQDNQPYRIPDMGITVKRDPGMLLILLGNGVLCLLMLWYFPGILKLRKGEDP
ncbi:hypothetical protein [Desulfuromonas sp. CSMB_57]|jgi:hypothetical protein|uniref:hypothetical protein n=1 Tax=Desulfuromonas sp. CSMB_57 TaxID=2807629 RepID=UPI001CD76453|nr:hypothetical protein [Desulfuromonas sp. CSMB_57]